MNSHPTHQKLFQIKAYFRFLKKSTNQHGIHSPFVYALVTQCLYKRKTHTAYHGIRQFRQELIKTGNKSVLNASGLSRKKSKLLNRLVRYFNPEVMLDKSSSLGMGSVALSAENNVKAQLIEPSKGKAVQTKTLLAHMGISKITIHQNTLENSLKKLPKKKRLFIYIGRQHVSKDLASVFEQLLPYTTLESVVVLDGIHQSPQTEKAWENIKNRQEVRVSVDLFFNGLVFFKTTQAKQHFIIRA